MRGLRAVRLKLSGDSGCERCSRSWTKVEGHVTAFSCQQGMYPLCEACWLELDGAGRLPFYKQLLDRWQGLDDPDHPIPEWEVVRACVLDESRARVKIVDRKFAGRGHSGDEELIWKG